MLHAASALAAGVLLAAGPCAQKPGYRDTPLLPGSSFHVHDRERPHPPVVAPGPTGPNTAAPGDAIVLFGGKDLAEWTGSRGEAGWKVADGAMEVNGTGNLRSKREFGDCQLHLEFATPSPAAGQSQERGNSGLFFFGCYEVQILDSYENVTYADGQCAALYGQFPPLVNACRKPGEWQSYDVVFQAPRFTAAGELASPARVTLFHNGVLVHLDQALLGRTAHRAEPRYQAHGPKGPIELQDHGNPVRFRNVWVRELDRPQAPPRQGG